MTIIFANGEAHHCSLCTTITEQQMAFIAIDDVTFAEAASIFSNPEMTSGMTYGNHYLKGYTNLLYVMQESFGTKACLTGGHDIVTEGA